jgi:hypothetical protein
MDLQNILEIFVDGIGWKRCQVAVPTASVGGQNKVFPLSGTLI